MPNRVEELEHTVSELESTVRGLTEELVETKERVRLLEELLEEEGRTVPTGDEYDEQAELPIDESAEAEPDEVAEAAAEAEADKSEGADSADEDADDGGIGDDIIVA
jgi:hypothetical protein